jgi:hypothetical protein
MEWLKIMIFIKKLVLHNNFVVSNSKFIKINALDDISITILMSKY